MRQLKRLTPTLRHTPWLLPIVVAFLSLLGVQLFFDAKAGFSWLWFANAIAAGWLGLHAVQSDRIWPSFYSLTGVFLGFLLGNTLSSGFSLDGVFMSLLNTLEVGFAAKLIIALVRLYATERSTNVIQRAVVKFMIAIGALLWLIAIFAGTYFSTRYSAPLLAASLDWFLSGTIAYIAVSLLIAGVVSNAERIRRSDWAVTAAILLVATVFLDPEDMLLDIVVMGLLVVVAAAYLNLRLVGWSLLGIVALDFHSLVGSELVGSHVQHISVASLYVLLGFYIALNRQVSAQVNSELRLSQERQRELFAVVGHELRTPVASIEMVIKDEDVSAEEKVATIEEITHNLLSVLEDMRTVVSPERAKDSREVYANPADVVRRAVSPLTQLLLRSGMSLELKVPIGIEIQYLFSDQALRQLVTNLVKNAAIHSHGSRVLVSLSLETASHSGDPCQAMLKVEDDGRGIPESLVSTMFEAFRRGPTRANGSGLGLFIAQGLAEELGGVIEYEPSALGGACFTVRFSLTTESDLQQAQAQAQNVTLDGLRILVVEDEPMLRLLSEKMLTKQGAKVTSCENGLSALNAFDSTEFDLVLTDLMMPEMDGYSLTAAIRKTGANTPIIAVTAAVVGEETDEALLVGADSFISKPISPQKVIEVMNKIVQLRHAET